MVDLPTHMLRLDATPHCPWNYLRHMMKASASTAVTNKEEAIAPPLLASSWRQHGKNRGMQRELNNMHQHHFNLAYVPVLSVHSPLATKVSKVHDDWALVNPDAAPASISSHCVPQAMDD